MEEIIYCDLRGPLGEMITHLSEVYNKPVEDCVCIIEPGGEWENTRNNSHKRKPNPNKVRCTARVWNNGLGGRCSLPSTNGSEFCLKHCQIKFPTLCQGCVNFYKQNRYHDYVWQHLGKYNDPLPDFYKCKDRD